MALPSIGRQTLLQSLHHGLDQAIPGREPACLLTHPGECNERSPIHDRQGLCVCDGRTARSLCTKT
eukprot:7387145-Prymnesium_polylepis.1